MSTRSTERTECDITQTQIIVDHFKIPADQRDDKWQQSFSVAVQTASFACGDPQTFTGPDGFPYFILRTPEPNQPFESFCISNLKDDFLLENGFGVAINPSANAVDWVFTYGDIVNLHLNKEFFTKKDGIQLQSEERLQKDEKVMVAQPSEAYLPLPTRKILKSYLQHLGIEGPKVLLLMRTIEGQMIQELAFNIFREDLESTEQLNQVLKQISWFLPRHYIILAVSKNSNLAESFADL